jgi:hypothetical protein
VPLFKVEQPFSHPDSIEFKASLKTFDYPSFSIQQLFRAAPSLEDRVSETTFKESTAKLLKL